MEFCKKLLSREIAEIPGMIEFDLPVFDDERGWFKENFAREKMENIGFPEDFFSPGRAERVLPKVTRIIPEASVIGMLLSHQKDPLIVASTQKGILQHDAFTWEVMGPSFIEKESLTRRAAASDRSLHKWIDHMDEKQREHLIGELFSVLEATGADTISQIQEGGLKSLAAMVRQLDKLEPQSKAMVQELITGLFGSWLELLPLPELDKKRFLP